MKAAVAQITCTPGNREANFESIIAFAEKASSSRCDIIVFPELVDTGYDMDVIGHSALEWSGPLFGRLQKAARRRRIAIICGLSQREPKATYNAVAVIDENGALAATYRKTHLFSAGDFDEKRYFTPGDSLTIVPFGQMHLGIMICYDLRFPELGRFLVLRGANALVVCAAWPQSRAYHWKTLLAARAIENQAYVIAANRVGKDNDLAFCGESCILDPRGLAVVQGSPDKQELLIADIEESTIRSVRGFMPALKTRRTDLYRLEDAC